MHAQRGAHLRVHLVVGPRQHDLARLGEAAEVVHVAVHHGVVAADAAPQPDDLLQTQGRLRTCASQSVLID